MQTVKDRTFDEERALYNLTDAQVINCTFAGPADGESALKEAKKISVDGCTFDLRYPFWHNKNLAILNCTMTENCRAALWYCKSVAVANSVLNGIKAFRECENVALSGVKSVSPELLWRCRNIAISNCTVDSQYFMFECKNAVISNLDMTGKYSFQYTRNVKIENSTLDTKDAFWHSKNVTVKNCTVKGEYLGWYSENLTLINCHIIGTQPLCYCKNLKLINCTTENCDLSFEYSSVQAEIKGEILSVKNPKSGKIFADKIGDIILESSVVKTKCKIKTAG
ncbi:MAG: DUF3737 family protein [Clostridia bacterium]|nr:DUF3737 family protein [Clostridia bacterium]